MRTKFTLLTLCALCVSTFAAHAQLTGTLSYTSLATAVSDLNTQGVGTGGATINISGAQTAPAGGYLLGSATLNSSLAANKPLVINGGGTVVVTASPGASATDAILKLCGVDYVTIQGFTLQDTATGGTPTIQTEWGIALLKRNISAPFDGCRFVQIQNNRIMLQRANLLSKGIYAANHLHNNLTPLSINAATDAHSFNRIVSNNISGCYNGIWMEGYTAPGVATSLWDVGNFLSADTVQAWGGNATESNGIYLRRQVSDTIRFCFVSNATGGGAPATAPAYGMRLLDQFNAYILRNAITIAQGVAAGASYEGINSVSTQALTGTAMRFIGNDIKISSITGSTGNGTGIQHTGGLDVLLLDSNSFQNMTLNGGGNNIMINVNANPFAAGGTFSLSGNVFSNITRGTANGGLLMTQTQIAHAGPAASYVISGNTIQNISNGAAGSLSVMGLSDIPIQGVLTRKQILNNTITGLTGAGSVNATQFRGFIGTAALPSVISGNVVSNLTGADVTGLNVGTTTPSTQPDQVLQVIENTVSALTATGANGAAIGINQFGNTGTDLRTSRNRVYDITANGTKGGAIGALLGTSTAFSFSDNFISDLKAPVSDTIAIVGILTAGSATTPFRIVGNTVRLTPVGTGLRFSVTGVGYSATSGILDLRNNIINISAAPGTQGTVVALRRASGTAGTPPSNYAMTSNNNIFWVPSGTHRHLYGEGITQAGMVNVFNLTNDPSFNASCGLYKRFMGSRDGASYVEDNLVAGTLTGTFAPTGTTYAESGGQLVAGLTTDFANNIRSNPPDIGALQFAGTSAGDAGGPSISYASLTNTYCTTAPGLSVQITDPAGVNVVLGTRPRLYFKKTTDPDVLATSNTNAAPGWKWVETSSTGSPYSLTLNYSLLTTPVVPGDTIQYFVVAQDAATTPNVSGNGVTFPSAFCPSSVALPSTAFPVGNSATLRRYAVMVAPVLTLTASTPRICISGTTTLTLGGVVLDSSSTIDYEVSANGGATWASVPGVSGASFTTPTLTSANNNIQYRARILCGSTTVVATSPAVTIGVSAPASPTTTSASRCGWGTVSFSAVAPSGDSLLWWDAATGGTFLGFGSPFTTPAVATTDTFYATVATPIAGSGGLPTRATGITSGVANRGLLFTAVEPFRLDSVTLFYSSTAVQSLTIQLQDANTGAVLQSTTASLPINSSSLVGVRVPVGFTVTPGQYRLVNTSAITLLSEFNAPTFPIPIDVVGSITNGWSGTAAAPQYNIFYNWRITKYCMGPRAAAVVTVTAAPAVTLTSTRDTLCTGDSVTLIASGAAGYAFSILPIGAGASQTVSPSGTTQYIAQGVNSTTGCVGRDTVTVSVFQSPNAISITPATAQHVCGAAPFAIDVTGNGAAGRSTIGTGTTTATTVSPFKGGGGTKVQMLYTAAELTAAGMTMGSRLDSLGVNISAFLGGPTAYYDFSIRTKWTGTSVFANTTYEGGAFTQAYYAPAFVPQGNGPSEIMFPVQTDVVWDGSSNLLVEICTNNGTPFPTAAAYQAGVATTTTTGNTVIWQAQGNSSILCVSGTGTQVTNTRPNLTLRFSGLPVRYSPVSMLFADAAGSMAYLGSAIDTVWARPHSNMVYVAASELGVCAKRDTLSVTVSGSPVALANNIGAVDTTLFWQNANSVTLRNADCELMATVGHFGPLPFSGSAFARVYLDSTMPTLSTQPFLQRHYDINPRSGSGSAVVTLYATQAEFDAYNAYANAAGLTVPLLPSGGTDNGNIRVTQYSGISTTGQPGSYTPGVPTLITPIVSWNSAKAWWEMTFTVTGFSGFFIHTVGSTPTQLASGQSDEFALRAYPNPVRDGEMQVRVSGAVQGGEAILMLTDASGRIVRQQFVEGSNAVVDMGGLPAGLYMLRYRDAARSAVVKVVRQ